MKIYIPNEKEVKITQKNLFVLTRPFFQKNNWVPLRNKLDGWDLNPKKIKLVKKFKIADVLLIPMPINYYHEKKIIYLLEKYDSYPEKYKLKVFAFVSGDFGKDFLNYKNITFFRMNGYRSRFRKNNIGFPATLSDQYKILFKKNRIPIYKKPIIPKIGFCGHATNSKIVYLHQTFNLLRENLERFIEDPLRKDYEVFFQSASFRYRVLKKIEKNKSLKTNFIFREKYRAGAKNSKSKIETTLEYYKNILTSNYIICLRGSGNFSIRFYETLMMGRIPVLIDTDCILPFVNMINWKEHVVWVDLVNINNISQIILDFHSNLSDNDFRELQLKNRKLWLEKLNPSYTLKNLMKF